MHVAVDFLHTLGTEETLGNHFHLYLGRLHAVTLADHRTKGTVTGEVEPPDRAYNIIRGLNSLFAKPGLIGLDAVDRGILGLMHQIFPCFFSIYLRYMDISNPLAPESRPGFWPVFFGIFRRFFCVIIYIPKTF